MERGPKLKIALVVPDKTRASLTAAQSYSWPALQDACGAGDVDLVVFPEGDGCGFYPEECLDTVAQRAEDLGVPVLNGMSLLRPDQSDFQVAVYFNPSPVSGETQQHLYVKHSMAGRLAWELPGYEALQRGFFEPISLGGRRIGVHICHDMFFGLIPDRLRRAGADVLINISGGDVNPRKWRNILQGRSLEGTPILCTMSRRGGSGTAEPLAYLNGAGLRPTQECFNTERHGGFAIFDLAEPSILEGSDDQALSDKKYSDITVALGTDATADLRFSRKGNVLLLNGAELGGEWTRVADAWVRRLPMDKLPDAAVLYDSRPPGDCNFVLYDAPIRPDDVRVVESLARLRAVEHRLGVLVFAGDHRLALKTNRYKNIQVFREANGRFGFDRHFLGGTALSSGSFGYSAKRKGIPLSFEKQYLSLATPISKRPVAGELTDGTYDGEFFHWDELAGTIEGRVREGEVRLIGIFADGDSWVANMRSEGGFLFAGEYTCEGEEGQILLRMWPQQGKKRTWLHGFYQDSETGRMLSLWLRPR